MGFQHNALRKLRKSTNMVQVIVRGVQQVDRFDIANTVQCLRTKKVDNLITMALIFTRIYKAVSQFGAITRIASACPTFMMTILNPQSPCLLVTGGSVAESKPLKPWAVNCPGENKVPANKMAIMHIIRIA